MDMFNLENHREFYSNEDYERVGGRKLDENEESIPTKGAGKDSDDVLEPEEDE
jgi:hypothetical protein